MGQDDAVRDTRHPYLYPNQEDKILFGSNTARCQVYKEKV